MTPEANRRTFSARDALRLPAADPSRVWVFVADLFNLPRWTRARKVEAAPELPVVGDMLSAIHRVGLVRYRVQYEVRDWEAGRRFLLALSGLPFVEDAELECRVESLVEPDHPASLVEVRIGGTAGRWFAGVAETSARRQVEAALRRLRKEFG